MGSPVVPMANNILLDPVQNPALNNTPDGRENMVLSNPQHQPRQIKLSTTAIDGGGITQLYLEDALGLGSLLGLVAGNNSQQMTVNTTGATAFKRFLQTFALIITGFDLKCTDSTQVDNNLQLPESNIDTTSDASGIVFASRSQNNYQNNPNLLNLGQGFVWTNTTNLRMNITAADGADITFNWTFYIEKAVPYAMLNQYLQSRATRQLA